MSTMYLPPEGMTYHPYRNGFGTAALVLGILANFLPFIGWMPAMIGIGLGFAGLSRCKAGTANNRGTALWGVWLSVVALVLWFVLAVVVVSMAA